ncbi:MAG TPA: ABC transporter substrate-binding protein [Acidimicrobiales bacterium]|nr:ABC transporter substrate-binding protein [Acidimicrobiales bacterium]
MDGNTGLGRGLCRGLCRGLAVLAAGLLLAAAACGGSDGGGDDSSGSGSGSADAAALLGPRDRAEGEPVKVGVVSDGRTAALDNTMQLRAAAAVARYINEHRGGIAGRPIRLVTCESEGDPGKAADCAAELIQAKVALVVLGETTAAATVQQAVHDAHIPLFAYGSGDQSVLLDPDSTFTLASTTAGLADLPIDVAKEHHLKKVTAVVIDVPAATGFYKTIGKEMFADAGIDLDVVPIPPGQADMAPQMTQIASGGPTVVHIIGNDAFCIAALGGLRDAGFDGPIDTLNSCINDSVRQAVGDYLKGVVMASPSPVGDRDDPGLKLLGAIIDTYGRGDIDVDNALATNMFSTMMGAREALGGLTGAVTPATITAAIKAMPETDLPGGGGLKFRCNGKAFALTPAVCTRGSLRTTLDAQGEPTLPYETVGASPIPG